jgi:hypothetical protein
LFLFGHVRFTGRPDRLMQVSCQEFLLRKTNDLARLPEPKPPGLLNFPTDSAISDETSGPRARAFDSVPFDHVPFDNVPFDSAGLPCGERFRTLFNIEQNCRHSGVVPAIQAGSGQIQRGQDPDWEDEPCPLPSSA